MRNAFLVFIILSFSSPIYGQINFTKHLISDVENGYSVYATDIDGDGDIDLLAALRDIYQVSHGVAWWENDGKEKFVKHIIDENLDITHISAADVNEDGFMDVLCASVLMVEMISRFFSLPDGHASSTRS